MTNIIQLLSVLSSQRCVGRVARPAEKPTEKPTDLERLELKTMSFAGICSTTELPVHTRPASVLESTNYYINGKVDFSGFASTVILLLFLDEVFRM